ncbi:MAG: single-stranded DNA-binding protein [Bacteroidetes bacterium]|jgi:single-strand DNA-binding protein|nr:single-stranded DNA-binding protein [Bacteroidota bacterium]MBP7255567.1 single-stranded DNA-binding protein [Chitinophagales bacterium]MBK7641294.1 single-stranded DNA-binding protein [Bacteroidota bacterium]MBK9633459.1 single-stranded DNA-binding protein [Bacteroidota bacterium]MBL0286220.1 single-stranded DNA-binding protein [Bacteroidota bacterium]
MRGVNKVILIGHLGKDPEVRKLDANSTIAKFSLATTEAFKTKDGNWVDQTEWHNIVMWRGLAERAERDLKKGMLIYLEGKIRTRSWEDKEGNKRYTTEVVVDSFLLLEKRNDQYQVGNIVNEEEGISPEKNYMDQEENDSLPF